MQTKTILEIAEGLLTVDERDTNRFLICLEAGKSYVVSQLKHVTDVDSFECKFAAACVGIFIYISILGTEDDGVTSFKAGDLTINSSADERLKYAESLKNMSLKAAEKYFDDGEYLEIM